MRTKILRFTPATVLFLMVLLLMTAAVSPLLSGPQEKPQSQQYVRDQNEHRVTVAVKMIQVYVTDKSGRPASDLTAEDFEILDNKKPVKLIHFEKHFLEEVPAEKPLPTPQPSLARKFLLLFDFAFTDARGLRRAREAALKFLESSLLPSDEITLLTYTALRGLTLHEYMTRDHEKIKNIVSSFGLKNATGRAENLASFYYSQALAESQSEEISSSTEESFFTDQARLQTGQMLDITRRQGYVDQARFYFQALNNLAKVLRTVPGNKNIVLFSSGIARQILFGRTGGAVVGDWQTPEQFAAQLAEYDAAQADAGLRSDFTNLIKEFKAANCTIFAVDISRAHKGSEVSEFQVTGPGIRELEGADSLKQLASQTGGRFYASTVNPENAMEEIVNLTKNYYVLGFQVDERWDGKFHKVKVKVRKKGYKVYGEGGYFNPKPFKQYNSFEKLLHLIEIALSDDPGPYVPVEIPTVSFALVEKGWPGLLTFARASGDKLMEVFGPRTEVYLLLFNEGKELVFIKKFKAAVTEKDKKEKKTFLPSFLVQVKPGKYECVMIMRNMETGWCARGAASVEIPTALPVMPFLDPPVLLRLDDLSREIYASGEPTLASLYGYNGLNYSPLAGEVEPGIQKIYAGLRLACQPGSEEDLVVKAVLTEDNSRENINLPVSILNRIREGYLLKLLVELDSGGLQPGSYSLKFTVSGPRFPQPAESSIKFKVKAEEKTGDTILNHQFSQFLPD
ncbi:MAG: VWA domain-containing protein [Candidatus Aminicenantes bacterium]|nr:VWA domain-containing protein [Candidatus Aminicenantes bacterium]